MSELGLQLDWRVSYVGSLVSLLSLEVLVGHAFYLGVDELQVDV